MDENIIFNSIKEYPDMIKVYIYNKPFRTGFNANRKVKRRNNPECEESSIRRSRTVLSDLCICNHFDLFCTFTFDPSRYDSKNILACRRYMNTWIRNAKERHSPALKYLIVPELHKSGAIHFHALLRGYEGTLKDSKHTNNGRKVYNIKHWHFGFSTAVKIDNIMAVSNYIKKYITKDMILLPGKKRYFCSQDLIRPEKKTNTSLEWLRRMSKDKVKFHATDDIQYYEVKKRDIPFSGSQIGLFE